MLTLVYHGSLLVIVCTALWIALEPRVPTGIVGTFCVGGVAMFSLLACESDPPNWLVGQTASLAGLCVWGVVRFAWRRHCIRRALRRIA